MILPVLFLIAILVMGMAVYRLYIELRNEEREERLEMYIKIRSWIHSNVDREDKRYGFCVILRVLKLPSLTKKNYPELFKVSKGFSTFIHWAPNTKDGMLLRNIWIEEAIRLLRKKMKKPTA